jgi:hypothetical protein
MTEKIDGRYEITSWDEQPYLELGEERKFTRATVVQTVHGGGLEGELRTETLMFYPGDGSARFLGYGLLTGSIDGRTGTFALESTDGTYADGVARCVSTVVPGSGTGELAGLRGTLRYQATHEDYPNVPFTFEYELG